MLGLDTLVFDNSAPCQDIHEKILLTYVKAEHFQLHTLLLMPSFSFHVCVSSLSPSYTLPPFLLSVIPLREIGVCSSIILFIFRLG